MTTQVQTPAAPFWSPAGLLDHLSRHLDRINAAHKARHRHLAVNDRDLKDAGGTRDDVVGSPGYQPHLPFFMQGNVESSRS